MLLKKCWNVLLLLLLILPLKAWSQQDGLVAPVKGWYSYASQRTVLEITSLGDWVYAATEGGIFAYNKLSSDTFSLSTVEGMSSIDPTSVFGDDASGRLFIGYADGMINYLDSSGGLHYVTDIFRNESFTAKRINHFRLAQGNLYIATDFGYVVYDVAAQETRYSVSKVSTNNTGSPVYDIAIAQGKVWLAMGNKGLWSSELSNSNLSRPEVWSQENSLDALPLGSSNWVCSNGDTLYLQLNDTIFERLPGQAWQHAGFPKGNIKYLNAAHQNVFFAFGSSLGMIRWPNGDTIRVDNEGTAKCIYAVDKVGFMGDRFASLLRWDNGIGFQQVGPPGPRNNRVDDLAARDGKLYIAPYGRLGSSAISYDKSGIPYFNVNEGGWKVLDHRNGELQTDSVYQSFYRAAFEPSTGHCFVGSWGEGMVEIDAGEVLRTYTSDNSGLPASARGHLIGGIAFDEQGNMWVAQYDNPLNLSVKTPEGEWHSFQCPYPLYPLGITCDAFGNKWIINNGIGIVVFNDNGTLDFAGDDQWRTLTTSYGNGNLPTTSVYAITVDHDQQVWIGTSEGVTVFYDPSVLWSNDFQDAACPIIEGYCLLRDQSVLDIEVDGDNRKWLATETGVFLVNLDGTELIEHFTISNSPLFDNGVKTMAIDPSTGEIFFGTQKGVLSYMGDAIAAHENGDELFAYPNPVRLNEEVPVVVKGMPAFSGVKIATASGKLVRQLSSVGGEVTWDLNDQFGNKVVPGIYLIMVANPEGQGAGITKIAVLEPQN